MLLFIKIIIKRIFNYNFLNINHLIIKKKIDKGKGESGANVFL